MAKVTEITYYVEDGSPVDWDFVETCGQTMKRIWGCSYTYGMVFIGDHAGCSYMQLEFDSYGAYAHLQDTWQNNAEWVAFLTAAEGKVGPVEGRQLLHVQG